MPISFNLNTLIVYIANALMHIKKSKCKLFWQNDNRNDHAKYAYQALMTFHLYQPNTVEYLNFMKEYEIRQRRDYNWIKPEGDDVSSSFL